MVDESRVAVRNARAIGVPLIDALKSFLSPTRPTHDAGIRAVVLPLGQRKDYCSAMSCPLPCRAMFILYGIAAGLLGGLVVGGRVGGLSRLEIRWWKLAVAGFLVQVVLFAPAMANRVGQLGPTVYVASTALVLVAPARNWRGPGLALVIAGAVCNLLAIVANGGYMPTTAAALRSLGRAPADAYSNSAVTAHVELAWLTDVLVMPAWMPFASAFSIGDLLIAILIAIVIAVAMRRTSTPRPHSVSTAN